MRTRNLRISALMIIGLLAAPYAMAGDEITDFARGASLYSANCGRCHNPRGAVEFSDAHWPLIVTHMRVVAGLPGEHARAIEAFLRATNNPPPRRLVAISAISPLTGPELIQRNGCQGCHTIGKVGGTIGPKLNGVFDRRTEDWVRVQIQSPREHNAKTVMPELGLTGDEVSKIIETLRTMTN